MIVTPTSTSAPATVGELTGKELITLALLGRRSLLIHIEGRREQRRYLLLSRWQSISCRNLQSAGKANPMDKQKTT
jgi:hypothetical protein